jgi:phage host-nuclease inhibitor protein Gam
MTDTAPSPQAITAWKNKADKLVALDAELTAAAAKLEKKLKPIREAHEPEIEKLKAEVRKLVGEVQSFGVENADVLFAEGSEIRTKVAIITGKLNPPSVDLNEETAEGDAIAALEASKKTAGFVMKKKSLDKPALKKALTAGGEIAALIVKAGVDLYQGFSVKVVGKGD